MDEYSETEGELAHPYTEAAFVALLDQNIGQTSRRGRFVFCRETHILRTLKLMPYSEDLEQLVPYSEDLEQLVPYSEDLVPN